jgi:hypothetical protein
VDDPRERVIEVGEVPTGERELALRVRRASVRWPLTELDPIERATFAGAVADARDFDDLDLPWQELIVAAECGMRPRMCDVQEVTGLSQ